MFIPRKALSYRKNTLKVVDIAKERQRLVDTANNVFKNIELPYLEDSTVVFFDKKKIMFKSSNPFLKSKIIDLESQYIKILKKYSEFKNLQKIEIYYENDIKVNNKKLVKNKVAQSATKKLIKLFNN